MATTNVDSKVKNPDYASPNFDGDFRLLELSLHSPNNVDVVQLNSSSVLQQIEIFEDLFSNVLRGTLTILDSQGLAELFPFVGEETLIMTFFTPGGEGTSLQRNRTSQTLCRRNQSTTFQGLRHHRSWYSGKNKNIQNVFCE